MYENSQGRPRARHAVDGDGARRRELDAISAHRGDPLDEEVARAQPAARLRVMHVMRVVTCITAGRPPARRRRAGRSRWKLYCR